MAEQPALMPIPAPWRARKRTSGIYWSRWHGTPTSCDDCVRARTGLNRPDTDLLRALWRWEEDGRAGLVCSVHAARRGR